MIRPKILFVLEDKAFFEEVEKSLGETKILTLTLSSTLESTLGFLSKQDIIFQGFFINPASFNRDTMDILKSCHTHHNSVPIFLLNNHGDAWVTELSKRPLGVQETVISTVRACEIIREIEEEMKLIMQILGTAEEDTTAENKEDKKPERESPRYSFLSHPHYFSVRVENFFCDKKCFFDIYFRMTSTKFVKIVNQRQSLEPARLRNYISKGLTHLYVKKIQREYFLKQMQKEFEFSLDDVEIPVSAKAEQVLNIGHQIIALLKDTGIKEQSFEFAKSYVGNIVSFIEKIGLSNSTMKTIMAAIPNYDHASGVAFLSALISRKYGIESHRGFDILGLAAFLHDIGLYTSNTNAFTQYTEIDYKIEESEFKKRMTDKETTKKEQDFLRGIYYEHPKVGGDMISHIPDINPMCSQIIYQHHMRNDNSGFPPKKHGIHPLSLIVGISEEFLNAYGKEASGEINPFVIVENLSGFPNEMKNLLALAFED